MTENEKHPPPSMQEILSTLTFFREGVSLVSVKPGRAFPIPGELRSAMTRLDAAIRLLGSLHCSPGAQIILGELGYDLQPTQSEEGGAT